MVMSNCKNNEKQARNTENHGYNSINKSFSAFWIQFEQMQVCKPRFNPKFSKRLDR